MTTEESNKLIAKFNGWFYSEKDLGWCYYHISPITGRRTKVITQYVTNSDLKYHTSWDWLMPVVEKIINLPLDKYHSCREKQREVASLTMEDIMFEDTLYKAVVEFIEWYNLKQEQ